MSAQCAATRAVAAPRAPAAVRRGTKSRAAVSRPASGRVGGRAVIVAATVGPPDDASVVREPRPEYIPSKIDDPNYVRVFDTTLRDGEQSPDCAIARAPQPHPCPKPRRIRQFSTRTRRSPPRPLPSSPGATRRARRSSTSPQPRQARRGHHRGRFPIASPDDLEAVRNIAKNVGNEPFPDGYVPVICGLSRRNKKDI